jgi:putative FmdB family regulatory protein
MPTYEYECSKGHRFEIEQSMRDPALKRCKICRSKAQRLISASSFILKGGGWYSDGYGSSKSGSNPSSGDAKSESKSSESTTSSSKSESKSDAKPDAKPAAKSDTKDSKPSGGSAASAGP